MVLTALLERFAKRSFFDISLVLNYYFAKILDILLFLYYFSGFSDGMRQMPIGKCKFLEVSCD